ncbi:MAG: hypothetical protein KJ065_26840 [Anaerolineae bacterium]|nr:hypothetical protein [Anaerolineae bacterium]
MYLALRAVSFILKLAAVVNFLFGVIAFFTYVQSRGLVMPFAELIAFGFLFYWFLLSLGLYASGQFIDLMLSIESNVRALARDRRYAGYDEKPRDLWEDERRQLERRRR